MEKDGRRDRLARESVQSLRVGYIGRQWGEGRVIERKDSTL